MATPVDRQSGALRPVMRLAAPVLAEQLLSMLVGFSDTMLTGWYLDRDHLAAVNLMVYAVWLLISLFVVVTIGATALVARFVGAGQPAEAVRATNQAFLLGVGLSVPATIVGLLYGSALVHLLQLEGRPAELAIRYWDILVPVLPAIMLISVGVACLRGAGDTLSGLVIMGVVNVVNIALSWALMLGWGPLPELGWDGVAWGTAIGYLAGGLLMVALLVRGRAGLRLRASLLRPDPAMMRRILRIGVPGGGDVGTIVGCQMWYLSIVNSLGPLAAAAHGVAIRIESVAYLPGMAFQVAATTLAGQYLGAKDHRRANHSVLVACAASLVVMLSAGVLFYTGAESLARLFLRDEQRDVARAVAPLLRTIALGMPALAILTVLTGALRGSGDTRWPLVFTVIGFLVVRIPLTYALTGWLSWGIQGAWYAMVADLYVRFCLVTIRFRQGGWTRIEV